MQPLLSTLFRFGVSLPGHSGESAPVPVSFYTDPMLPSKVFLTLRNTTGASLALVEELLPWNDWSGLELEAHILTNGKAMPLSTTAEQKPSKTATVILPGEVRSGSVDLNEVIVDFDRLREQGDIAIRIAVRTPVQIGRIQFTGQPAVLMVPRAGKGLDDDHPVVIHFQSAI